jgi:hypothetical protein
MAQIGDWCDTSDEIELKRQAQLGQERGDLFRLEFVAVRRARSAVTPTAEAELLREYVQLKEAEIRRLRARIEMLESMRDAAGESLRREHAACN